MIRELNVYHPDPQWSLVAGNQYLTLTADAEGGEPRLIARFCQGDKGINREVELPLSQLTPEKKTGWRNGLRGYWSMDDGFSDQSSRRVQQRR